MSWLYIQYVFPVFWGADPLVKKRFSDLTQYFCPTLLMFSPRPEAGGGRGPAALLLLLFSQGQAVTAAAKPRRGRQRPSRG